MLLCFFSFLQLARGIIYVFVLHSHELFGNILVRVDETNKLADVNVTLLIVVVRCLEIAGRSCHGACHDCTRAGFFISINIRS